MAPENLDEERIVLAELMVLLEERGAGPANWVVMRSCSFAASLVLAMLNIWNRWNQMPSTEHQYARPAEQPFQRIHSLLW